MNELPVCKIIIIYFQFTGTKKTTFKIKRQFGIYKKEE